MVCSVSSLDLGLVDLWTPPQPDKDTHFRARDGHEPACFRRFIRAVVHASPAVTTDPLKLCLRAHPTRQGPSKRLHYDRRCGCQADNRLREYVEGIGKDRPATPRLQDRTALRIQVGSGYDDGSGTEPKGFGETRGR